MVYPRALIIFASVSFLCNLFPSVYLQTYDCTTNGKFRYPDPTCRGFYMCVMYNGNYVKSNYTCPSAYMFNPTTQMCSTTMICIDDACDNATTLYNTVPDPNAVNCSSYILCKGQPPRVPTIVQCDIGTYYNKRVMGCSTTPNC